MLNAEISQISGVRKYRERHFKRLGLHTAYDMLCYFPRSYEDSRQSSGYAT
jgi:RecG-like helicase